MDGLLGTAAGAPREPEQARAGAIEFHHVTFVRPGGQRVVDDLDLSIAPGEVLALVGRSGAGKTTILKLINRLLLPSQGAVRVEGRDTSLWDPYALRRHIGYIMQEVGLFPHLTVEQNVAVGPRIAGWPEGRRGARALELLDLVGLTPDVFARRWPAELSGGQRQRVGFARALALDPPILLMDEPFGALDPLTRAEMHREFHRLQSRLRKTVVMVTHDMGEAFALAGRLGVLEAGRLVICDTPARVLRSGDPTVRVFLDAYREAAAVAAAERSR
jgi:osmoprotectant transport system ATP-binding protein